MGQMTIFMEQENHRVRSDTNNPDTGTPTWISTENQTSNIVIDPDTTFRIRFTVNNSGTANFNDLMRLQVRVNTGGGYGAWTDLDTGGVGGCVYDAAAAAGDQSGGFTLDKGNLPRLTAGDTPSTVEDGAYKDSTGTDGSLIGQNGASNIVLQSDEYTEIEVGLSIVGANAGDLYQFRLVRENGGTSFVFDQYDFIPTIEIASQNKTASGSPTLPAITASGLALVEVTGFGALRQRSFNAADSVTDISDTFDFTPVSGNLLVAIAHAESSTEALTLTGWNALTASASAAQAQTMRMFWKISDGTESGSISVTGTTLNSKALEILEFVGPFDASPLSQQAQEQDDIAGTTQTGPTITTEPAGYLAVASFSATAENTSFSSWTNNYIQRSDFQTNAGTIGTATKITDGATADSVNVNTDVSTTAVSTLATFKPGGAKTASGSPSIPAVTGSGEAKVRRKASGTPTLPSITASGAAKVIRKAAGAATLAAVVASGAATVKTIHTASGAATVPAVTASGNAQVVRKASGAVTLPAITANGAATVVRIASDGTPTLTPLTASGTAKVRRKASGAPSIPAVTASGNASVAGGQTASGAATTPSVTGSGEAKVRRQASGAATIPALTASGNALVQGFISANGAPSIPSLVASGVAKVLRKASGAPSIPAITASGNANIQGTITASGAASIPSLVASGNAKRRVIAQGSSGGTWGFRDHAQNGGTSATASVTHNIAIQAGDFVVAFVHSNDNLTAVAPIQGTGAAWTEHVNEVSPGETNRFAVFTKIANGTEPDPYQFTVGNANWRAIVHVFSTGGGTPVVDLPMLTGNSSSAANLQIESPNGRVIADNSLSLVFGGKDNRTSGTYDTATESYLGVIGSSVLQASAAAYRIFPTSATLNSVVISSDTMSGEPTLHGHISFKFTGGGITTPAVTASGNATVGAVHTANGAVTIPSLTASGTAKVVKKATGTPTIPAATASGAAKVVRKASGAVNTPAVTASGNAAVQGINSASGNPSIPAITANGSAKVHRAASGAAILPAVTASGNATIQGQLTASGAVSIPAVTASGAATIHRSASGAVAIPSPVAAGVALVVRKASGSATIPSLLASGTAQVVKGASGAATIPAITASGAAKVHRAASGAATLPAVTANGLASVNGQIIANGAVTLPAVTASGTAQVIKKASGAATLPAITAAGNAKVIRKASGAATLPSIAAAGTAQTFELITASGGATLAPLQASGVAKVVKRASGSPTLPAIVASGNANTQGFTTASGNPILPAITAAGSAKVARKAAGSPTLPAVIANGAIKLTRKASGAATLPAITASGVTIVGGIVITREYTATGYVIDYSMNALWDIDRAMVGYVIDFTTDAEV